MKSVIILVLLCVPFASAALITGNLYDYELRSVNKSVLTINTTPEQHLVIRNASYHINLPPGIYTFHVETPQEGQLIELDEQTIRITDEGTYTIDFLLFPDLHEEEEPHVQIDLQKPYTIPYLLIGILLIIIGISSFVFHKKRTGSDLLSYLREHKRTTQKELRKIFPRSEAAISLELTDLEHQGRIKKIKKGRGNIIIFVR